MIHVLGLRDENTAELFAGFVIGDVCRSHVAVLPGRSQGGLRKPSRPRRVLSAVVEILRFPSLTQSFIYRFRLSAWERPRKSYRYKGATNQRGFFNSRPLGQGRRCM
jgi:hypothetical protein